ncbi:unnamed protein product [Peniophora sp. CBMAI 1063]|nr:unnamed protein product [Peniophora sp. CBMAI 1063]
MAQLCGYHTSPRMTAASTEQAFILRRVNTLATTSNEFAVIRPLISVYCLNRQAYVRKSKTLSEKIEVSVE